MSAKDTVLSLFQFVQGLNELRQKTVSHIKEYPWHFFPEDLPDDPEYIKISYRDGAEDADRAPLLTVKRPNPDNPSQGKKRNRGDHEKTARLFDELYGIYTDSQRDAESMELIAANGLINDDQNSGIYHPVLTRRIRIRWDAGQDMISLEDTDTPTELYETVFQEMNFPENQNPAGNLAGNFAENLASARAEVRDCHPMDRKRTPDLLEKLSDRLSCKISWKPCFLLRKRPDRTGQALRLILDDLEKAEKPDQIPAPMLDLALISHEQPEISGMKPEETIEEQLAAAGGESPGIFLSKEANREQLEIARQLAFRNAVLVQGPPGTGKTHTIANLIGHFLAEGKSVLVTSHTSKALQVLKEKIAPRLQNLCVSVMDDSSGDMEKSVDGISDYLSGATAERLKEEMDELARERADIIQNLAAARKRLYDVMRTERGYILYQQEEISPSAAAKFVREHARKFSGMIPGQVRIPASIPLDFVELRDLYRGNQALSPGDEKELSYNLPSPDEILNPAEFEETLAALRDANIRRNEIETETGWNIEDMTGEKRILFTCDFGQFEIPFPARETLDNLRKYLDNFGKIEPWMEQAVTDGRQGGAYRERWTRLMNQILQTHALSDLVVSETFGRKIQILSDSNQISGESLLAACKRLKRYLKYQKKLLSVAKIFDKSLRVALESVKIDGNPVESVADCDMILHCLELGKSRVVCARYWNELMSGGGTPKFEALDEKPEQIAKNYVPQMEKCLEWYQEYGHFMELVKPLGLPDEIIITSADLDSELAVMRKNFHAAAILPRICDACEAVLKIREANQNLDHASEILKSGKRGSSVTCARILDAMAVGDADAYARAYAGLKIMYDRYYLREKRDNWLNTLSTVAPSWSEAIRRRVGIHGKSVPPEMIEEAWKWKQLSGMLDAMEAESFDEIQSRCFYLSRQYREKTAEYAEKSAWHYLRVAIDRNRELQSALEAWKQTVRRIGKGTGKRAPMLKARARNLMKDCQAAVPAWIMPINRALEMFTPGVNQFDIVIIDEASQSDLSALAVLYMGKKLVIVGDEQQVSPMAVGLDIEKVEKLRELYLTGKFPRADALYEKTSIYDFAALSIQHVMLREHFRCVPEIIGFSNFLSYDNQIKPLRESGSSNLLPAVIHYRVPDGARIGGKNPEEAKAIAALMEACISQPEYADKTFGVISLLGDEQVKEIQDQILRRISPEEIEKRRILAGNASNFQGDERDVIFLSVVDSAKKSGLKSNPVRLMGYGMEDAVRKRYNVAASRARDQLWVAHSLDPETDLQSGDIRQILIDYAMNPASVNPLHEQELTETEFEAQVARALTARGYHIARRWEVGAYRIALVAVYREKMIAIECEGERYHSGEARIRGDLERQTILERLGWRFIRIRGSAYFRDPDAIIERVIQKLSDYGVLPIAQNEAPGAASSLSSDANAARNRDTELSRRVLSRAAQILSQSERA